MMFRDMYGAGGGCFWFFGIAPLIASLIMILSKLNGSSISLTLAFVPLFIVDGLALIAACIALMASGSYKDLIIVGGIVLGVGLLPGLVLKILLCVFIDLHRLEFAAVMIPWYLILLMTLLGSFMLYNWNRSDQKFRMY